MQQQNKNNQQQNSHKVLHVIEYFPGFVGYTGGGAERLLERLITAQGNSSPKGYRPLLYVANKKERDNHCGYPFVTVEDPERIKLEMSIQKHNHPDRILHFGNTFLIHRHPERFRKIVQNWKGPIIQRVTLSSRVADLFVMHQDQTTEYLSRIDAFISQSDQMTKELLNLGISAKKITQIENGIDCETKKPLSWKDKVALRKKLVPNIDPKGTLFLFVGRLGDPTKKVDELLETWRSGRFAEMGHHLVLAGNYDKLNLHASGFANKQDACDWSNVIFTGHLKEQGLDMYFQAADVYVSASEREGFSNSVLEAMSYALPVLVRKGVSGYEHLIVPGKTGLLFRSPTELSKKILYLASSPLLRKKLGASARAHVIKNYSIEQMVEKYRQLYSSLLVTSRN